jgi:predicted phosphoribosyltransferase
MGVNTEKYIRKPLYVDAVRVTEQNFNELTDWCQGELEFEETKDNGPNRKYIRVRVHNPKGPRQTKAFVGDWILYTDRGYKIYTNKAFKAAFDPVPMTEPDEIVVATPQAIKTAVDGVHVSGSPTAPPAIDDSGKRVITIEEQRSLTALEVRELISSGEAILEQDLAA